MRSLMSRNRDLTLLISPFDGWTDGYLCKFVLGWYGSISSSFKFLKKRRTSEGVTFTSCTILIFAFAGSAGGWDSFLHIGFKLARLVF
jgi:hypothetical protein